MKMDEYEKMFFELLKYVDFIKDDKVKIQRFISGLPSFYNDKIQYDNLITLEEVIRRFMRKAEGGSSSKRLGMKG